MLVSRVAPCWCPVLPHAGVPYCRAQALRDKLLVEQFTDVSTQIGQHVAGITSLLPVSTPHLSSLHHKVSGRLMWRYTPTRGGWGAPPCMPCDAKGCHVCARSASASSCAPSLSVVCPCPFAWCAPAPLRGVPLQSGQVAAWASGAGFIEDAKARRVGGDMDMLLQEERQGMPTSSGMLQLLALRLRLKDAGEFADELLALGALVAATGMEGQAEEEEYLGRPWLCSGRWRQPPKGPRTGTRRRT